MDDEYVLYHSTFMKNLPSIRNYGLITGQPPVWEEYSEPEYLYLTPDPRDAFNWGIEAIFETIVVPKARQLKLCEAFHCRILDEDKPEVIKLVDESVTDNIVVLEIEIPSSFLDVDYPSESYRTTKNIPPNKVSVYRVIDRDEVIERVIKRINEGLRGLSPVRIKKPRVVRKKRERRGG